LVFRCLVKEARGARNALGVFTQFQKGWGYSPIGDIHPNINHANITQAIKQSSCQLPKNKYHANIPPGME
jgi:hypothetical protein